GSVIVCQRMKNLRLRSSCGVSAKQQECQHLKDVPIAISNGSRQRHNLFGRQDRTNFLFMQQYCICRGTVSRHIFSCYFCGHIMINSTEAEEREYLEEIKEKLELGLKRVEESVRRFSDELRHTKAYIHEHQSGMDEADMVAAEQSVNRMAFTGESAVATRRKILKLRQSPYFARIDFSLPETESKA